MPKSKVSVPVVDEAHWLKEVDKQLAYDRGVKEGAEEGYNDGFEYALSHIWFHTNSFLYGILAVLALELIIHWLHG